MFPGMAVAGRGTRRRSPVHPASPVRPRCASLPEEGSLPLVGASARDGAGRIEDPAGVQIVGAHQGAVANAAQEIGLAGFERDQATEDVEHVYQLRGVLGDPAVGLDPFERGRRAPVADDGPGAVAAAVAEPLDEDLFARDFVLLYRW